MDVFDLFAKISLDSSEYDRELDDAAKKTSRFGDIVKATLTSQAIIAGTKKIAQGIAGITQASFAGYAEYEQLVGGVETLFKNSAGTIQRYAENAYKTAGLTANEYMTTATSFSASLLQGLSGDTEKAAQITDMAITDMADNMNKMGSSMESIQNAYMGFSKQNYTMLDNLKLGYGGTKTEMERLLADAEKLTGIHYDISNLADVYSAIHAIQTEIGITGTTALEAEKTLSGSIASMKSAWQNLIVGIADENANLDQLVDNVVKTGQAALGNIIPFATRTFSGMIKLVTKAIPAAIKTIYTSMKASLPEYLKKGKEAMTSFVTGFVQSIPEMISAAGQMISKVVSFVATNLPKALKARSEIRKKVVQSVIKVIPEVLKAIKSAFTQIGQTIVSEAPKIINFVVETATNTAKAIREAIPEIVNTVKTVVPQMIEKIKTEAPKLISTVTSTVMEIVGAVKVLIPEIIETAKTELPELLSQAGSIFNEVVRIVSENLPVILEAVGSVIQSVVKNVGEKAVLIGEAIKTALPAIIAFVSNNVEPFLETGFAILTEIAKGIWAHIDQILGVVLQVLGKIGTFIADHATELFSAGFEIISKIASAIWDNRNEVAFQLGKVLGDLINLVAPYIPQLLAAGGWLLGKILQGVIENLPKILDVAGQFVSYFAQGLGEAVPALQPLTDIIAFLGDNLETLAPIILGAFGAFKVISTVMPLLNGLSGVIGKVSGLITKLPQLLGLLTSPIGIVVGAIATLAAGFVYLYKTDDEFAANVNEKWEQIKQAFSDAIEKIKPILKQMGEAFDSIMQDLKPVFEFLFTTIAAVVEGVVNAAAPIMEAIGNVVSYVADLIGFWSDLLHGDFTGAMEHAKGMVQNFFEFFQNIWEAVGKFWEGFFDMFGIDIGKIKTKLVNFANAVKTGWGHLKTETASKWNSIKESIASNAKSAWSKATDWFGKMASSIGENSGSIGSAITEKIGAAIQWLMDLPGKAWDWGKDLIQNFLDGIKAFGEDPVGAIGNIAQKIKDRIAFSEPKTGPLSDFHTYAPDMMKLFTQGIKDNEHLVTDQIEKSFDFSDSMTGLGSESAGYSIGETTITMNIYGAAGQDVNELAEIISQKINAATNRRKMAMGAA